MPVLAWKLTYSEAYFTVSFASYSAQTMCHLSREEKDLSDIVPF